MTFNNQICLMFVLDFKDIYVKKFYFVQLLYVKYPIIPMLLFGDEWFEDAE